MEPALLSRSVLGSVLCLGPVDPALTDLIHIHSSRIRGRLAGWLTWSLVVTEFCIELEESSLTSYLGRKPKRTSVTRGKSYIT